MQYPVKREEEAKHCGLDESVSGFCRHEELCGQALAIRGSAHKESLFGDGGFDEKVDIEMR